MQSFTSSSQPNRMQFIKESIYFLNVCVVSLTLMRTFVISYNRVTNETASNDYFFLILKLDGGSRNKITWGKAGKGKA